MSKKPANYYVVWSGKEPGIYSSWDDCKKQVIGVEGAKYKGFQTREQAEEALLGQPADYIQKKAAAPVLASDSGERPLYPALAVDGACSGNPGKMEYQGVDAETGAQLFHYGPALGGTNNIGEFLAIVHALALMQQQAARYPEQAEMFLSMRIYSDSKTAQAWVRKRKCATKLQPTPENAELFRVVQRAEAWLQTHTYRNPILKWKTELWGEIPADFGRK